MPCLGLRRELEGPELGGADPLRVEAVRIAPPPLAAAMIARHAQRDREQPRLGVRARPILVDPSQRDQVHVLKRVIDRRFTDAQAAQVSEHEVEVLAVEHFEPRTLLE